MKLINSNNPYLHSLNIQSALARIIDHMEFDATLVKEPRFEALLETSREVLRGLHKAFADFDRGCEPGWGGAGTK